MLPDTVANVWIRTRTCLIFKLPAWVTCWAPDFGGRFVSHLQVSRKSTRLFVVLEWSVQIPYCLPREPNTFSNFASFAVRPGLMFPPTFWSPGSMSCVQAAATSSCSLKLALLGNVTLAAVCRKTCQACSWAGNCDEDIDECESGPCQNGGLCEDSSSPNHPSAIGYTIGADGFRCSCVAGFAGHVCQTDVNECISAPCLHGGTCAQGVSSDAYVCICTAGYTDSPVGTCLQELDECASFPCQHGATCFDKVSAYVCVCDRGYSGAVCQTNVDDCVSSPCMSGGKCQGS